MNPWEMRFIMEAPRSPLTWAKSYNTIIYNFTLDWVCYLSKITIFLLVLNEPRDPCIQLQQNVALPIQSAYNQGTGWQGRCRIKRVNHWIVPTPSTQLRARLAEMKNSLWKCNAGLKNKMISLSTCSVAIILMINSVTLIMREKLIATGQDKSFLICVVIPTKSQPICINLYWQSHMMDIISYNLPAMDLTFLHQIFIKAGFSMIFCLSSYLQLVVFFLFTVIWTQLKSNGIKVKCL